MEIIQNTILIIEDDLGLNELISEKIIESGFQTFSATSTNEAINWLSENTPTLMVVDYSLNDMTAKDFIEDLNTKGISVAPFIVSTGQGNERVAVEMMKLGARDYIIKDTNLLELLPSVIGRVVNEIQNENKLKIAETELKESNEKYRLLIDNSGLGVGVYDLEGNLQFYNQKALQNLGGKTEDYIGKSLIEIFGEAVGSVYHNRIQDAIKSKISLEYEDFFESPSGKYWFLSNHTRIKNANNEIVGVQVLSHDITERKLAQLEIERIGKHYQSIIVNAPDGFVLINSEGNFKYVSPSGRRIFGYDQTEEIYSHPNNLTHPDDLPMVLSHLMKLLEDPSYIAKLEYRYAHKNGHWIWIESTFTNLLSDPNVESIVINFRDITERKKMEHALTQSQYRFKILFEDGPDAMLLADPVSGKIVDANNAAMLLFKKQKSELVGMFQYELHPTTNIELSISSFKQHYEKTTETGKNVPIENTIICSDGTEIPVEILGQSIQIDDKMLMLGNFRDITDRKKTEDVIKFLITCGITGSGEDFFESLAKYLSQVLEMEYVCIDRLDKDGLTAHTLAIYNDGVYDTNVSYTLHQTPCGEVVGKHICCFPENVCNLFPYDDALRDLNAESYVGSTLWSFDGMPIGLIAIIGSKPMKNKILAETILGLVSVRAAGELERKQAEDALRESESMLLKSQEIAQLGTYSWDITKGYWTSSAILDNIFGIDDNYIRTTQGWVDLIHPDWQGIMSDYITNDIVLNHQRFDKEYKVVRKENGQECWVHGLGDLEFDSSNQPIKLFGTISNINQRKLVELAIQENEAKMKKVLVESSILIDVSSEAADYQKITNTVAEISGAKYVSFDVVNNVENIIQTYAISGVKENLLKISSMLGFDVVNKKWKNDPIRAERIKKQIVTRFNSINDITSAQIPLAISKVIEKTFNLGEVVIVKIAKENETIAFFTLFFSKEKALQNTDLLELFANEVSLFMERKKAEEALIKKMNEMEYFQSITIGRELKMIELKKEINQLLNASGKENKYIIVD